MRRPAALGVSMASLALAVTLCGCAPLGVGLVADNRGAAIGLSAGVPQPAGAARERWRALPPPRLVDPADPAATPPADTPKATP